jgi:hypothetical protein
MDGAHRTLVKSAKRPAEAPEGRELDGPAELEAARGALLRAKQAELDQVESRHDDLVRLPALCF